MDKRWELAEFADEEAVDTNFRVADNRLGIQKREQRGSASGSSYRQLRLDFAVARDPGTIRNPDDFHATGSFTSYWGKRFCMVSDLH